MLGPVGIRVHLTGDEEVGMDAAGDGGGVRDGGSLRHIRTGRDLCWNLAFLPGECIRDIGAQ